MSEPRVLFTDRLFDGTDFRDEPLRIELSAGRITRIAPRTADERLPASGIDARGGTVLPGFIDAHSHLGRAGQFEPHEPPNPGAMIRNLEAALEGGVTSVGDMGCTAPLIAALRSHTAASPGAGPTIRASGPLMADPNGYPLDWISPFHRRLGVAVACGDERSAKAAVRRLAELGMDHVKICIMHQSYALKPLSVFSPKVARAFVEEAHALGLRVFAHAHWDADYRVALAAGVDALMHSSFDALAPETVAMVEDSGIPVCPTLWVFHSACLVSDRRWHLDPERRRGVNSAVLRSWKRYAEAFEASGDLVPDGIAGGITKQQAREGMQHAIANLMLLHDRGVRFAYGSDGPFGFSVIGRPYDELSTMRDAGLGVVGCLRAATAGSAALLGYADRGQIEPGRAADLLVVDGDPRKDLATIARPRVVLRGGVRVGVRRHRASTGLAVAKGIGRTVLDAARSLARDV